MAGGVEKAKDRVWFKKSRRGNLVVVRKEVREHYLRDDVPLWPHAPFPERLVVPDGAVCLAQWDVLCEAARSFPVLLLQTVVARVKEESLRKFRQLREGVEERSLMHVFANEHSGSTYGDRQPGETLVHYSERLIAKCVQHITASHPACSVVVLSDSLSLTARFQGDQRVVCSSTPQWVEQHIAPSMPHVTQMIAQVSLEGLGSNQDFAPHLTRAQAQTMLLTGALGCGRASVSENRREAWVSVADRVCVERVMGKGAKGPIEVLIDGSANLNRAMHGDSVAVRIHDRSQWKAAVRFSQGQRGANHNEDEDDEEEGAGKDDGGGAHTLLHPEVDEESGVRKPAEGTIPTGSVVCVLERGEDEHCGTLQATKSQGDAFRMFVPLNKRFPKVRIRVPQADHLEGRRIIVRVDSWRRDSRYPDGHYVGDLGVVGDPDVEAAALMRQNNVVVRPFSLEAMQCLPPPPHEVPPSAASGRLDLRKLCIASIDPEGCVDIDDALHARWLGKEGSSEVEVGVHIADVTHYVRAGTPLDREAAARGCTVYLVDRRVDMLPKLLGENLCSLHSGVDRLAFSVIWRMDSDANVLGVKFAKTVIHSRAAMTYAQAQAILEGRGSGPPQDMPKDQRKALVSSVLLLRRIAGHLRARRIQRGALTLASPEVKFELDTLTQQPKTMADAHAGGDDEAHWLVEELMLLANCTVAERILAAFPTTSILRNHPPPHPDRLAQLQRTLAVRGLHLDASSSKRLGQSLDEIGKRGGSELDNLVRTLTTACMQPAEYFCAGDKPSSQYRHFGLALDAYTHYTSPIRRYADVLVHRLLEATLGKDGGDKRRAEDVLGVADLSRQCRVMNERYKSAQRAGRDSSHLFKVLFLRANEGVYQGFVATVRENGFGVVVARLGMEGVVRLDGGGDGNAQPRLVDDGRGVEAANGRVFRVLDEVWVRVFVETTSVGRFVVRMEVAQKPAK